MLNITQAFTELRKRNKVAFTIIVSLAVILFWKGAWGLMDIIFDTWMFRDHLFWSNLVAVLIGLAIISAAGLILDKLV